MKEKIKTMYLLAYKLVINNPITHKEQTFKINVPDQYYEITKK